MIRSTLFVAFLFGSSGMALAAAPKADCEKAMKHLYALSGMTPNDEAHKNNVAKCQKEQTKESTTCILAAKDVAGLAACKK
jgi:hypothetical protein